MSTARVEFSKVAAPRKIEPAVSQRWDLFPYLIIVTILLMLVSLFHVWSRVKVVDLNLQIAGATKTLNEYEQDKNRLRLEVASLKNPARIELLAKGELGMALPDDQQVIVVK